MKVVCALLVQKGKLLVARKPQGKTAKPEWEFPGGKVEEGESFADSISRELREEMALELTPQSFEYLGTIDHAPYQLHFLINKLQSPYKPQEHPAVAWLTPEQAKTMPLSPGDREAIDKFQETIAKYL